MSRQQFPFINTRKFLSLVRLKKLNQSRTFLMGNSYSKVQDDQLLGACVRGNSTIALQRLDDMNRESAQLYETRDGNSVLYYACTNKMTAVALRLLDMMDLSKLRHDIIYCVDIASQHKSTEPVLLKILKIHSFVSYYNPLREALYKCCLNKLEDAAVALLHTNIFPTYVAKDGCTPLIAACYNSMPRVALLILKTDFSMYTRVDKYDNDAYYYAKTRGLTEVVIELERLWRSRLQNFHHGGNSARLPIGRLVSSSNEELIDRRISDAVEKSIGERVRSECCVCNGSVDTKIVFVPCGHGHETICNECLFQLRIKGECPLCRETIQCVIHVY